MTAPASSADGAGEGGGDFGSDHRLTDVRLNGITLAPRTPEADHERSVAIFDLLEENRFRLPGADGPYLLCLGLEDDRLVLDVRTPDDLPLHRYLLSLRPFRRLIKDYAIVCDSYYSAIKSGTPPSRIEAIDMGRRGLHNDGADLLVERLTGKIDLDHDTARRLFTLIAVLHGKG